MYVPENNLLYERLVANSPDFHQVVDFDPAHERLVKLDFTKNNTELTDHEVDTSDALAVYVNSKRKTAKAKFGIGGYNEDRILYNRSSLFDATATRAKGPDGAAIPLSGRTLHLGTDIWGEAGTKVYAPLGGMVHSFAFNDHEGDYGATLILLHQLNTLTFYTLYGHLSLADIARVSEYQYIIRGHEIGHFGLPAENGNWPPHLHFQVIKDMGVYEGDYPGVCAWEERENYLKNCPDPDAMLRMMRYA